MKEYLNRTTREYADMFQFLKKLFTKSPSVVQSQSTELYNSGPRPIDQQENPPEQLLLSDNFKEDHGREKPEGQPICPYCKNIQDKWPDRNKKKCTFCKKTMYLRYKTIIPQKGTSNYLVKDNILVTEKDAWVYDWTEYLFVSFRFSRHDFEEKQKEYVKKHGVALSNRDAVWSILNELLAKFMTNSDFHDMEIAYRYMARFLQEEGRDSFVQLQQGGKMRLLKLQADNCNKVRIGLSKRKTDPVPCDICLSLENKSYSVSQALKELPIPPMECRKKYCYTYYQQVFSGDPDY